MYPALLLLGGCVANLIRPAIQAAAQALAMQRTLAAVSDIRSSIWGGGTLDDANGSATVHQRT
jgi:hypothetical protein